MAGFAAGYLAKGFDVYDEQRKLEQELAARRLAEEQARFNLEVLGPAQLEDMLARRRFMAEEAEAAKLWRQSQAERDENARREAMAAQGAQFAATSAREAERLELARAAQAADIARANQAMSERLSAAERARGIAAAEAEAGIASAPNAAAIDAAVRRAFASAPNMTPEERSALQARADQEKAALSQARAIVFGQSPTTPEGIESYNRAYQYLQDRGLSVIPATENRPAVAVPTTPGVIQSMIDPSSGQPVAVQNLMARRDLVNNPDPLISIPAAVDLLKDAPTAATIASLPEAIRSAAVSAYNAQKPRTAPALTMGAPRPSGGGARPAGATAGGQEEVRSALEAARSAVSVWSDRSGIPMNFEDVVRQYEADPAKVTNQAARRALLRLKRAVDAARGGVVTPTAPPPGPTGTSARTVTQGGNPIRPMNIPPVAPPAGRRLPGTNY